MYHEQKNDTTTENAHNKIGVRASVRSSVRDSVSSAPAAAPAGDDRLSGAARPLGKNIHNAAISNTNRDSRAIDYGFYGHGETDNNPTSYRYALLDAARVLLRSDFAVDYLGKEHQAAECLTFVAHGQSAAIIQTHGEEDRARLTQVCRCHRHNVCPNCAQVEGQRAAVEVQSIIDHLSPTHLPIMVTLTAHHSARMSVEYVNNRMFEALRRLTADGTYKRLLKRIGCEHTIRRFEFTYGKNGSHPHFHMLWFLNRKTLAQLTPEERLALRDEVYEIWRRVLEHVELWCSRRNGVDISVGSSATAQYISKLGALVKRTDTSIANEVARLDRKHGRKDNRTIWQLLHDVHFNDDQQAGVIFVHYTKWAHGRVMVKYSNSLKAVLEAIAVQQAESPTEPAEQPETWHDLIEIKQADLFTVRRMEGALGGLIRLAAVTKDAALVSAELERVKQGVSDYFHARNEGAAVGKLSYRTFSHRATLAHLAAGKCDTASHNADLPCSDPGGRDEQQAVLSPKQLRMSLKNVTHRP